MKHSERAGETEVRKAGERFTEGYPVAALRRGIAGGFPPATYPRRVLQCLLNSAALPPTQHHKYTMKELL